MRAEDERPLDEDLGDHRIRLAGAGDLPLLRSLLAQAAQAGIRQLSLSVELENPGLRVYERFGFRRVGRVGGAWTLVADARR